MGSGRRGRPRDTSGVGRRFWPGDMKGASARAITDYRTCPGSTSGDSAMTSETGCRGERGRQSEFVRLKLPLGGRSFIRVRAPKLPVSIIDLYQDRLEIHRMRIAYLVLARDNPVHFERLACALDSSSSTMFVHVDAHRPLEEFSVNAPPNCRFLRQRISTFAGQYSAVEACAAPDVRRPRRRFDTPALRPAQRL